MGNSATDGKADADRAARKAQKKARKAERKANEQLAKEASDDAKNPISGKKEKQESDKKKSDKILEKQLLEVEKKLLQNLAESKKLEAEAKQLLQQAEDADKLAKRVAKALKKTTGDGDSQLLSNLTHDDDADSKENKDVDAVVKDAAKSTTATSKGKPNGAIEAAEEENSGEKKKKNKKKSKSKAEEGKAVEEAASTKAKTNSKRKRDEENAEQPVSKKEKKAKGGEKVTQATTEQIKIQGLEGGAARQDKFLRLLGGKKAGANATKPGSMASGKGNSVRAEAAIQQQFEAGMMLKESGHKRRGLGA
ncbi:hypothetical protein THAR02_03919 [Trichoderma harzianum]|uniref:Small acidic protein-like domain-containing protein n=1 Tax=Trichoderma harzianum TaxID=5544 RepID=A0A0G0AG78_TRIHA|nr:hypothetical protein THAR02_03919 [Trichoderma harzianum]